MRFSFWPWPSQTFADVSMLAGDQVGWLLVRRSPGRPSSERRAFGGPGFSLAGGLDDSTTLAALSAVVPRLRFGTLVSGNTFRNPALVAKMSATLDHMTSGRVALGLGAAWDEAEHRAYGIPFPCQVIKPLFERDRSSFEGKHYRLQEAPLMPTFQSPLPLVIGGIARRTLRIAARYADEWNTGGTVERMRERMKILDSCCVEEGRDPREIKRSAWVAVMLTENRLLAEQVRKTETPGVTTIVGSPAEARDVVTEYREIGVDELIVSDFILAGMDEKLEVLERFIRDVAGR